MKGAGEEHGREAWLRGQAELLESKREYNREYMRRWRSDPAHRERERVSRVEWNYARKLRRPEAPARPLCAFCHERAPVGQVARLVATPGGFRAVRVPYCGQC